MIKKLLTAFFLFLFLTTSVFAASTPNKNYNNQTTGTNLGTWGINLNSNFSLIDNNLGGTLTLSVAGNSNVTLSTAQAQYLIYNFTGVLTGNIDVIFPAAGGLYFINNDTTGAYTLTIYAGTSTTSVLIPQGTQVPIYVDNSTNPPTVGGATGTQYVYTAPTVGGTANALTIASTLPSTFTLSTGTLLTFVPSNANTASATLQTPDGTIATLKKLGSTGLVNLNPGDLIAGTPQIAQYTGTYWDILNLVYYGSPTTVSSNFSLGFSGLFIPYIATSAINVTLSATTSYGPIYWSEFLAYGGAITLIPNGSDNINGINANFIISQGASGRLYNDGAGNWWVYFNGYPPGQIKGTSTNDNAAAGNVGEYISATLASGSAISLTSATPTNVTSISLTAGDWDISGTAVFGTSTATANQIQAAINTTSATLPGLPGIGAYNSTGFLSYASGAANGLALPTGTVRIPLTTTTTVYLITEATFSGAALNVYGFIRARRIR